MLFSGLIDKPSDVVNDWSIMGDKYNNNYIIHDSTHQKIRLGKNVKMDLQKVTESDFDNINVSEYEIPNNIFISNNNKNMNISIMNFWTDDVKVREEYEDPNILYITLYNKNYKMISYNAHGNDIIKTYRKKGVNQGCAIRFENMSGQVKDLFTIYAKKNNNDFVKITFTKNSENGVEAKERKLNNHERTEIHDKYLRVVRKYVHFKMEFGAGKLPTAMYFVDPQYTDVITNMVKDIPNSIVVTTTSDSFFVEGEDKEKFKEIMTNALRPNRIKAITAVGVDVPYDFCKEYSILYLFKYDIETHKLTCLKSN